MGAQWEPGCFGGSRGLPGSAGAARGTVTALRPPGRQGALCTGRSRSTPRRSHGALWGGKMAALSAGRTAVRVRGGGGGCRGRPGARGGDAGPRSDAGSGAPLAAGVERSALQGCRSTAV